MDRLRYNMGRLIYFLSEYGTVTKKMFYHVEAQLRMNAQKLGLEAPENIKIDIKSNRPGT